MALHENHESKTLEAAEVPVSQNIDLVISPSADAIADTMKENITEGKLPGSLEPYSSEENFRANVVEPVMNFLRTGNLKELNSSIYGTIALPFERSMAAWNYISCNPHLKLILTQILLTIDLTALSDSWLDAFLDFIRFSYEPWERSNLPYYKKWMQQLCEWKIKAYEDPVHLFWKANLLVKLAQYQPDILSENKIDSFEDIKKKYPRERCLLMVKHNVYKAIDVMVTSDKLTRANVCKFFRCQVDASMQPIISSYIDSKYPNYKRDPHYTEYY